MNLKIFANNARKTIEISITREQTSNTLIFELKDIDEVKEVIKALESSILLVWPVAPLTRMLEIVH